MSTELFSSVYNTFLNIMIILLLRVTLSFVWLNTVLTDFLSDCSFHFTFAIYNRLLAHNIC